MRTLRPHRTCQGRVGRWVTLSFPALVLGFHNLSRGDDLLFAAIFCFAFSGGRERWEPHGGGMAWWSVDGL